MPRSPWASLLLLSALLGGCESTTVAPMVRDTRLEDDERRLWVHVRDEEATFESSGFVADLPEQEQYLNAIVARLHPDPMPPGAELRVKIIADPTLNAFALPDGALYVHTGMLARLDNEAQLAAVLGHELTHAVNRHGLKSYRSLKNHTAFATTFMVGVGGGLVGLLGQFGALSSAMGYSRDLEREADDVGFQSLLAAGYAPREGAEVFGQLLKESKRSKIKEPFFFGSHPGLQERISHYGELVAALPPERREQGRTEKAAYDAMLPPILALNADAALHAGDLDFARDTANRLRSLRPNDGRAAYYLGEVSRRRGSEKDHAEALEFYRQALAVNGDFAEASRGLGLELMRAHDNVGAVQAFNRYLELRPAASDRAYIQEFIRQCDTKP